MGFREQLAVKGAALFAAGFLVSWLVGGLAMDLRTYVLTRFGGVYGPVAAYYAVHYVLFQLTLAMVVYVALQSSRFGRLYEALFIIALTAGKLLGRAGFEPLPTPAQLLFSLVISTQLSMAVVLVGYRVHQLPSAQVKNRTADVSLETYTGLAVLFWFTVMPAVDRLGSDLYSNLLRTAMALTLMAVGYRFYDGRFSLPGRAALLTAFCTAGLVLASLFADILWGAATLTALPLTENLNYVAALAFQGFFLALTTCSGIWLNLISKKTIQVEAR